ncbi:MAG: alanine racemase [Allosphingosinicella sp.]|uniref:alanine racemase n=1 Tax=Allosphingosinicella sp. TaxID=2823234 RepID=UPI0039494A0F
MMPAAVLREAALHHNIREMQAFADRQGARLCPHGKTTMSPEIFRLQLDAGAWGLTAATAHHVRVYRRLGVARIFLANQLVAPADIAFILGELAADPGFDFFCLADSAEGIDLLAGAAAGLERPLQLLVETGFPGGRSGARSVDDALALARRIAAAPGLALRGFETFEGIRQTRSDARDEAGGMLDLAVAAAELAAREGLFGDGPVLLSAGGSAFLDLCAARLPTMLAGRPVERVLRPGCYVTHDDGLYERVTKPDGAPYPGLPGLRSAIEVWATVQSRPEPGLAIVGAGKRDLSFDVEPPVPIWHFRPGTDDVPRRAEGLATLGLWDQHAAIADADGALAIGDLIGFGISHPCATFDRWTALLTVDEQRNVNGCVTTLF